MAGGSHLAQSALTARSRVGIGPGLALSVGVHALMFGGAWIYAQVTAPRIDLSKKPIVARLVRLGEVRPPQLLPRRASATRAAAPQRVSVPSAAPGERAAPAPKTPSREDLMTQALAKIMGQVPPKPAQKEEPLEGSPEGSPLGETLDPEEGDRYLGTVKATIEHHYTLPATISERERLFLRATLVVWIAPDGKIIRYKFEKKSDNEQFDRALESAMAKVERFPPPPSAFAPQYRDNGIGLNFAP